MVSLPSSLSRRNFFILASGPVHQFKCEKDDVGPQPTHLPGASTTEWNPIQRIIVKNKPAARGIENVLLFIGPKDNFRSQRGRGYRKQRAIDRGFSYARAGKEEEDNEGCAGPAERSFARVHRETQGIRVEFVCVSHRFDEHTDGWWHDHGTNVCVNATEIDFTVAFAQSGLRIMPLIPYL